MYHRYLSLGNGQFQRQRVAPQPQSPLQSPVLPPPPPCAAPAPEKKPPPPMQEQTPELFLRRLFPGMDRGDLLVLLILLLLLLEGNEDAAPVILTLAIFLMLQ